MAVSERESRSLLLPRDTTAQAVRVECAVLRRLGIEGRDRLTFELSDHLREVLASGVRFRHPDYSEGRVRLAVVRLTIGEQLFREAFPGCDVKP